MQNKHGSCISDTNNQVNKKKNENEYSHFNSYRKKLRMNKKALNSMLIISAHYKAIT